MDRYQSFVPVNILTGFLGSGKTTLLQRLLASPRLARTAVLINELGEVGLDHLLLQHLDEQTVLLKSGCLCCTIRGDLSEAIRGLYDKRARRLIPRFDRLAVETTGLADPAPIVFTLMAEPVVRHHFRLGNIVTTVDAVNGRAHLDDNPESVKQVAVADRLVITKTDIAEAAAVAALRARLARLNPTARLLDAAAERFDAAAVLTSDPYDPATKSDEVRRWLRREADEADEAGARPPHGHDVNRHDRNIRSFAVTVEEPLDWTAFGIWLTMLLHAHGPDVLRVKGLLNVAGVPAPVVIHGVQHVIHPPAHLDAWPDADRRSRIVFIVRGLEPAAIERSLAAFNRLANPSRRAA